MLLLITVISLSSSRDVSKNMQFVVYFTNSSTIDHHRRCRCLLPIVNDDDDLLLYFMRNIIRLHIDIVLGIGRHCDNRKKKKESVESFRLVYNLWFFDSYLYRIHYLFVISS